MTRRVVGLPEWEALPDIELEIRRALKAAPDAADTSLPIANQGVGPMR